RKLLLNRYGLSIKTSGGHSLISLTLKLNRMHRDIQRQQPRMDILLTTLLAAKTLSRILTRKPDLTASISSMTATISTTPRMAGRTKPQTAVRISSKVNGVTLRLSV